MSNTVTLKPWKKAEEAQQLFRCPFRLTVTAELIPNANLTSGGMSRWKVDRAHRVAGPNRPSRTELQRSVTSGWGRVTATSIGITIRALTDLKRQHSMEGEVVLGAAVLDDILGVVLLALLYEYSIGGGVNWVNSGRVILFVVVFFLIAPFTARLMSILIRRIDLISEIPGMIPTTIVSLVLFFAWLAHAMGVPELLGGFAAGLALSRRFFLPFGIALKIDVRFAERIVEQMRPIVYLFTPIFFVTVGLSLNLREIDWSSSFIWMFSAGMLTAAVAGKMLGAIRWIEEMATMEAATSKRCMSEVAAFLS